jgi:hypothetical protein
MSALAHPGAPVAAPSRRRHLALVPDTAAPVTSELAVVIPFPVAEPAEVPAVAPLRLTTRGRRVLAALVLVTAAVVGAVAGMVASSQTALPTELETVTVSTGESLWSVAVAVAGDGDDPREVMAQIAALNDLDGDVLQAGQVLMVPAGD